jgi:signal transduction histidine kinase
VNLEVEIPEDSSVHADHVQISQVILNLLNNSFHVARNQEGGWIKLLCERVNGSCRISVIDCGQGVADEVLKKIFDPFFTTKDVGEGTGLGMSISQRLLELHGSEIKYKLTDGHTTFYFELECKCAKQVA